MLLEAPLRRSSLRCLRGPCISASSLGRFVDTHSGAHWGSVFPCLHGHSSLTGLSLINQHAYLPLHWLIYIWFLGNSSCCHSLIASGAQAAGAVAHSGCALWRYEKPEIIWTTFPQFQAFFPVLCNNGYARVINIISSFPFRREPMDCLVCVHDKFRYSVFFSAFVRQLVCCCNGKLSHCVH